MLNKPNDLAHDVVEYLTTLILYKKPQTLT
jgi:hypothetical protein